MRCEQVQRWLSRTFDDERSSELATAARRHVAQCTACQEFANSLPRIDGLLDRLPAPLPSSDFVSRTLARLPQNAQITIKSRRRGLVAPISRATAAAAAFAVGVWGATELQRASADEAPPAAVTVLSDWFEATPPESLASRYLAAIHAEEG